MSGLPREILKWIQSLDLSHPVRNTRRDFANGYLVAEIFSWYFPQEIEMHSYDNGTSLQTRQGNWSQLQRFFLRHDFDIPKEVTEGTIHCKPNAAAMLMEKIYGLLTNRAIKSLAIEEEFDFTDGSYQAQLPAHARSTASMAIKNNISSTELSTDPDRILCRQKAQAIVNNHIGHRRQERVEDPRRFGIRPTLGQLCPRKVPSSDFNQEDATYRYHKDPTEQADQTEVEDNPANYAEIQVNQLSDRSEGFLPPIHNSGMYSMVH